MSLVIRHANLRGEKHPKDIFIENGRITKISDKIRANGIEVMDAKGMLVSPAFIDSHLHLDKDMSSDWLDLRKPITKGTFWEEWDRARFLKERETSGEIEARARQVIASAVLNGTTAIRSHVDVDTICGLKRIKALLKLKGEFKNAIDIQTVAFPQEGILKDPGTEELLAKAMELGADLLGGIPEIEASKEAKKKHVDMIFRLARRFNVDVDMHIDQSQDPTWKNLELLISRTRAEKYFGRVTASHVVSLAYCDESYAKRMIREARESRINVTTSPASTVIVGLGITRVKEFLAGGVNVSMGQDSIKDPWVPFGRADMLEVALIGAHVLKITRHDQIETLFDMITTNGAVTLGLKDYGIHEGGIADLVVIDALNAQEAIRTGGDRRYVFKNGRKVAETKTTRTLLSTKLGKLGFPLHRSAG